MYGYEWTGQNGIYRLSVNSKIEKEIRPVFKEELDYFGFNEHWTYPDTDAPLLWAEGIRRYILNGTCVAEATGGGFYTKPTIKIYTEGLNLEPIDVDALWKENERLMLGLEKTSMDFIRKTHDKYEKQGMAFAVAFSGGKDSLVLLDLVSRTLSPDEFSVVFSNTGMELSTTIQSVEKAKKHWPSLKFYEAKSHLKPTDSWEEFGPPGRRMRWCCAVHKSVPTILLLRELTGNYNIKVVVFDGVRAEESAARADRDEISVGAKNINQTMTFDKPSQIQTALKDYMEFGEVQGFDAQIVADAGVIVLGNINASRFNVNENMMEEVSSVFSESASLDRFHGFIPGWKIPRMHQGLVANGWALNTEYFAEVLHLLRDDLTYTTIVDECLAVPAKPDKRDLTAIKRLCTAFVKLLYPNATCKDDIPADEFIKYCLEPAKEMRGVIKKQLCIIDPKEFNVPGKKDIPDIQYNYM